MAPRKTASAVILLGLDRIPVAVYPATNEQPTISLATLHAKCGSRVKQQYVCPTDGEVMKEGDTVKGYELGKGNFLKLSGEEYEETIPKPDPEITIKEVTELAGIDPCRWTGRVQYLGVDAGDGPVIDTGAVVLFAKIVGGLREASDAEGAVAIGRWAARGADKQVAIYPKDGRLVLQEMRRQSEIRDIHEIEAAGAARSEDLDEVAPLLRCLHVAPEQAGNLPDERYDATVKLLQSKAEAAATKRPGPHRAERGKAPKRAVK